MTATRATASLQGLRPAGLQVAAATWGVGPGGRLRRPVAASPQPGPMSPPTVALVEPSPSGPAGCVPVCAWPSEGRGPSSAIISESADPSNMQPPTARAAACPGPGPAPDDAARRRPETGLAVTRMPQRQSRACRAAWPESPSHLVTDSGRLGSDYPGRHWQPAPRGPPPENRRLTRTERRRLSDWPQRQPRAPPPPSHSAPQTCA